MIQKHFHGQIGCIQVQDNRTHHEHHLWFDTAPPDDPDMSEQCFQCRRLTWRFTPTCVHCKVPLAGRRLRQRCGRVLKAVGHKLSRGLVRFAHLGVFLCACLVAANTFAAARTNKPDGKVKVPAQLDAQGIAAWSGGHDAWDTLIAISRANLSDKPGSYETTDQWKARIVGLLESPVYAGAALKLSDRFAFVVQCSKNSQVLDGQCEAKYDADEGRFRFTLNPSRPPVGIVMDVATTKLRSYTGQNAYGVKRVVSVEKERSLVLNLAPPDELGRLSACASTKGKYAWKYAEMFAFDLPMRPEEAARQLFRLVVVGKLALPFASAENSEIEPTIDRPVHTIEQTGVVHMQVEQVLLTTLFGDKPLKLIELAAVSPCDRPPN